MSAVTDLLRELESVTHIARMRRMVEVGRAAKTDARMAQVIAELERGGFYERMLALQSCYGSGDGELAVRALGDPSRTLQGRAVGLGCGIKNCGIGNGVGGPLCRIAGLV